MEHGTSLPRWFYRMKTKKYVGWWMPLYNGTHIYGWEWNEFPLVSEMTIPAEAKDPVVFVREVDDD